LYIGAARFANKQETSGAPLAARLFDIPGVDTVSTIGRLLIITKGDDENWQELAAQVEAVLTAYLVSGFALSTEQVQERMQLVGRGPREKIQYLLDHQINPGVAAHAGFVELLDVRDGVAYVRMGGGCQGCGAADFTLRQGIEAIILKEVPEVREIRDVTDHAAGTNPYYQPNRQA
jgi:Fe-S cluster biogenesis protein NfuA